MKSCQTVSGKEEIGVVLDQVGLPDCITPRQLNRVMKNTYRHWKEELYFSYLARFSLSEQKPFHDLSKGMKMKLGISAALLFVISLPVSFRCYQTREL